MSRFELVAIPRTHWESAGAIAVFVADALACERRIAKEVNLANEYGRYIACCQGLEHSVSTSGLLQSIEHPGGFQPALLAGRFPIFRLDTNYISLLAAAANESATARFGNSFFPPDMLAAHRQAFEAWIAENNLRECSAGEQRLGFFKTAEDADCGVVELQSSFHVPETKPTPLGEAALSGLDQPERRLIAIPPFEPGEEASQLFSSAPRKKEQARILREDIRQALQTGQPVTFGNRASHDVITEVLNEFVFVPADSQLNPASIRVVYADGSEAQTFPVFALRRRGSAESNVAPLRAALMSMRHLLLDADVDLCWFRNREVSRSRTLAEADDFCFKTTLSLLAANLSEGPLLLELFHTGFEPAVIGFYRGVVSFLAHADAQTNGLEVVPFYFRSEQPYERGASWRR